MQVLPPETTSMATRDGVRLDADVYRPDTAERLPVLLMRQPYARRIASTVCYAHPAWYAAQGFIVAIQDVRGQGSSEGECALLETERDDGFDTVEWAARLPGSNGAVGMYGFSYQGVTQLLAAAGRPPALKAITPAMVGWDLRHDWAQEGTAFSLTANVSWAIQLAALAARRAGDGEGFAALSEAARQGGVLGHEIAARPAVLERYAHYVPHYRKWLETPPDDPYWARISPAAHADQLAASGIPALFVGGWFDTHLSGTIAAYRAWEDAGAAEARLVVGPWAHFPWGRHIAGCDFGEDAIGAIDQLQVQWFNRHLKGELAGEGDDQPQVRLFDLGAQRWRDFASWPQGKAHWSIASTGRAAVDPRDGRLSPGDDEAEATAIADRLVHDPWRPVTSTGGAFAPALGPADRTEVHARPDVLTYTSTPLEQPLALAGIPQVTLSVGADRPSFDVSCVLSLVDDTGRARFLTEGYVHCPVPPDGTLEVALRPVCVTIGVGERLCLSLAAASYPAFPVNPGTGRRPVDARIDECEVTTLIVDVGSSIVTLPLVPLV